jgi:hypothetical protein
MEFGKITAYSQDESLDLSTMDEIMLVKFVKIHVGILSLFIDVKDNTYPWVCHVHEDTALDGSKACTEPL